MIMDAENFDFALNYPTWMF